MNKNKTQAERDFEALDRLWNVRERRPMVWLVTEVRVTDAKLPEGGPKVEAVQLRTRSQIGADGSQKEPSDLLLAA